jgi:serine/threonine-protein kinase
VGAPDEDSTEPPANDAGDESRLLGQLIAGRYRMVELLASGGMGAVYLAEHISLRKRVAVKVLRPDTENYAEMAARFEREAIAGAQISHPNVVSATDFDRLPDGTCFLVLEYVRGVTLHHLLRQLGPLPETRAVHIARQIAAALGAAHCIGILHRDLKPRNIMLVEPDPRASAPPDPIGRPRRDHVKLIDFGLCKVPMDRISTAGADTRARAALTGKGVVFGTPPYMAPETALGMDSVDERADLYALGIVLYRMLAGCHPFDATTETEHILANRLCIPPPIRVRVPGVDVSREVESVVMRLLKKDVRARYESAAALIEALDRALPAAAAEAEWVPWTSPLPVSVAGAPPPESDEADTEDDFATSRPAALLSSLAGASAGPQRSAPPSSHGAAARVEASADYSSESWSRVSASERASAPIAERTAGAEPDVRPRVPPWVIIGALFFVTLGVLIAVVATGRF